MNKQDFLWQFRRCHTLPTLEKVVWLKQRRCAPADENVLALAADHRRAEITTGKLFDRIPASVWRLLC